MLCGSAGLGRSIGLHQESSGLPLSASEDGRRLTVLLRRRSVLNCPVSRLTSSLVTEVRISAVRPLRWSNLNRLLLCSVLSSDSLPTPPRLTSSLSSLLSGPFLLRRRWAYSRKPISSSLLPTLRLSDAEFRPYEQHLPALSELIQLGRFFYRFYGEFDSWVW